MENKYTIGLDFGTSSGRAVLVEINTGKVAASAECTYRHQVMNEALPDGTKLKENWALQYPQDYIEVLEKTVSGLMKKSKVKREQVVGLAIDFTSCTILPVDEKKMPLCMKKEYVSRPHAYVKLWKHHAAQREADFIYEKLNIRLSSEMMLPKILEIVNEDFEIYRCADQILEAGDWLGQLLTGTKTRSASMASYKSMWGKSTGYGLQDKLQELHPMLGDLVKAKLASEIYFPGERIGGLTQEWAGRLGLLEDTAVSAAIIDAHAGVPGCGITKEEQMMLVLGTSTVQAVLSQKPYTGKGICGDVKDTVIQGYYAWESGIAAAGDSYEWFVRQCVPDTYIRQAEEKNEDIYQCLGEKAQFLPPGSGGLLALEWWNGNKTPYLESNRKGVLIGCTLQTKPEQIYRALLEATAFGSRQILEVMEGQGLQIREIFVCGGISRKNDLLMQICADVLNKEILVSVEENIPALGAAMYAAVAAGDNKGGYASIQEAVSAMGEKQKRIFKPIFSNVIKYQKIYELYQKLEEMFAPAEDDIMTVLNSIS